MNIFNFIAIKVSQLQGESLKLKRLIVKNLRYPQNWQFQWYSKLIWNGQFQITILTFCIKNGLIWNCTIFGVLYYLEPNSERFQFKNAHIFYYQTLLILKL